MKLGNIFILNFMAMSLFVCAFHVCESKGGLYVNVKLHFFLLIAILECHYRTFIVGSGRCRFHRMFQFKTRIHSTVTITTFKCLCPIFFGKITSEGRLCYLESRASDMQNAQA